MASRFGRMGLTALAACCSEQALAATPPAMGGNAEVAALAGTLDMIWVIMAATLVMIMQIGFMLLEAGSVRTKNAISVAQKNVLDFAFATLAFAAIGFAIAFGAPTGWLPLGSDLGFVLLDGLAGAEVTTFFVFQVMFCGTAATIVSGAVAERMKLRAYVTLSVVFAAVIYPLFARWAWGNALAPAEGAFLANIGFVDFAGSTVVHATGGWFALAACLLLGPRRGRFKDGPPMRMGGHSAVLASGGALFLFVGWIGFNGGSTLGATAAVPGIILNTILAGAAGGVAGYGLMWFRGAMLPERSINGLVGGLVAITAGCHLVGPGAAILLGALGGLCANGANHILETRFRIDDAVGAVGVHAIAGIVGTLGLALLAPVELLPAGSRIVQLLVQATGSLVNFALAFGLGLVLIACIRPFVVLRVSADGEEAGLNVAEHGARLGTDHIQAALEMLAHSEPNPNHRLQVEEGDENEHLTTTLNGLMDKLQHAEAERFIELQRARDADEEQRMVAFGDVSSEAIILLHDRRVHSVNAAAAMLYASTPEALIGRGPEELIDPESGDQMAGWLEAGDDIIRRAMVRNDDGELIPVELRFREMVLDQHRVTVLRMTDMREREEAQRRIYHLALHDPLTDLPNRELFNRRLNDALAHITTGGMTALLLIDVDRFKSVNDLHGHPSGDMLLAALAERLLSSVRGCDTVARLGGDEFAIIYTNITFPNQALDLAFRIIQKVGEPLTLPTGTTIHPRVSIGLAIAPEDSQTAEGLIRNADLALYAQKQRGRNGYSLYRPEMGKMLRLREELEGDLTLACERGELELHYQPRIDVATGEVASFEALVRWRHGDRLIAPDDFISIAEDSGLIIPIGAWVIEEACRTAVQHLRGAAVSVNVSARQFQAPDLKATIVAALMHSGLAPQKLELEITESVLIDDYELAVRMLSEIRALGVRVALDDFGTGYSSLSYLTRFRFDTIKLDRRFIQATDERTWHVIRSVFHMSAGLNTAVVAEGVETQEQLDRLVREGCQEVQGYLVSRPMPVTEIAALLAQTSHAQTNARVA